MFKCFQFSEGCMFSGQPQQKPQSQAQQPQKPQPTQQPQAQQTQQPQPEQHLSPPPDDFEATVTPNFLWASAYYFLYIVAILAAIALSFMFIKYVFHEDLFLILKESIGYIGGASNGESFLVELLLHEVESTILLAFVQIVVFVMILQIPLANKQWKLFKERMQFKEGFLFVKRENILYLDVATVSFERYISGLDFGKVLVEYSGKEGHVLEMPYVYPASIVTYVLNDLVKERKAEVALQKKVEEENRKIAEENAKKAPQRK